MYAWIWRHLPFGRWGKAAISLALVGVIVAVLWYAVFPWAEPLLPFDDVQVTDGGEIPTGDTGDAGVDEPSGDHAVPYSTSSNNPATSGTPSR